MSHEFTRNMPVTNEEQPDYCFDSEHDWWFDNGKVCAMFTTYDNERVDIHEFFAKDGAMAGMRTGIGREAITLFRQNFKHVVANGVGDECDSGVSQHPAFRFWRQMLDEGLIDKIVVVGSDVSVTRTSIQEPLQTRYGTIYPDPEECDPAYKMSFGLL